MTHIWILAIHVACNGLGFIADQPKDCVRTIHSELTYASEAECEAVIRDQSLPYIMDVSYDDLFCVPKD